MIKNEKHKQDLIKIANKLKKKSQSCPIDEDGNPTETYLEYISLMYNPKVAKIAMHLEVFPKSNSARKLAKQLNISKKEIADTLQEAVSRSFIYSLGNRYALANPLMIHDAPFILKRTYIYLFILNTKIGSL
jgi:predicted HTH transcriptional regulator